ncbi:MAG: hypothetical protein M5U28_19995 [Sandaracinaceae bacterium]|nr:hypothetical protein [Sandaracinaceae bacterium]
MRTANGRPIEGATVLLEGADARDPSRRARTDARGRAQLTWTAPAYSSGLRDVPVRVSVSREGVGSGAGFATVRVAADEHAAGIAVEGGALSPELGGRVFVRVVGQDGRPAGAGVPVRLTGPRLPAAGASGVTDDDGVASLDVALGAPQPTGDRCGGQSATALEVQVGGRTLLTPCLPLDPDAAARVRVARPRLVAGQPLELSVERVRAAARAPVEVSVLGPGSRAIASTVVAPGDSRAALDLPADAAGVLWVRARPLIGNTAEAVRGGTAAVWVSPGAPLSVRAALASDGTVTATLEGPADEAPSAYVVAAPIDLARALASTLRARTEGPLGELRRDPARSGEALLAAALAVQIMPTRPRPPCCAQGASCPCPRPPTPPRSACSAIRRAPARAS